MKTSVSSGMEYGNFQYFMNTAEEIISSMRNRHRVVNISPLIFGKSVTLTEKSM